MLLIYLEREVIALRIDYSRFHRHATGRAALQQMNSYPIIEQPAVREKVRTSKQ